MKNIQIISLSITTVFYAIFTAGLFTTNTGSNLLLMAIEKTYIIPEESSVISFYPRVLGTGSGAGWVYAEDNNFYYHFIGDPQMLYLSFAKARAKGCVGFSATEYKTWCLDGLPSMHYPVLTQSTLMNVMRTPYLKKTELDVASDFKLQIISK